MAFWGIEVKPGRPVTHKFDPSKGKLHVSQAALGLGSSTNKSVVQCIIGDRSPVILCVLLPDKTESCHLDLEFEEADDVIISVIGPRSVFLTGYFSGGRRLHNDSSESYGIDIENSDGEKSFHSSDCDDSFIDDDDPQIYSSESLPSYIEKKPKVRKDGHKRLKKRYMAIESEDGSDLQLHDHVNDSDIKTDDDDSATISTFMKSRAIEGIKKLGTVMSSASKVENGIHDVKTDKASIIDTQGASDSKSKKERKEETKEITEDDSKVHNNAIKEKKTLPDKTEEIITPVTARETCDALLPSANSAKKTVHLETIDTVIFTKGTGKQDEEGDQNHDNISLGNIEQKLPHNKNNDISSIPVVEDHLLKDKKRKKKRKNKVLEEKENAEVAQIHDKDSSLGNKEQKLPDKNKDIASSPTVEIDRDMKRKKKRKKCTQEKEENEVIHVGLLSETGKNTSSSLFAVKNGESKLSKSRTLSNGVIIEDLDMGKPDGKTAALGKKVKVHYVGKLRDEGNIIETNIGKPPLKIRLGAEGVTEGWNIGLDGMCVGGKRRVTIPPTMGGTSQEADVNIPSNTWLVYEFELAGVR